MSFRYVVANHDVRAHDRVVGYDPVNFV